MKRWRHYQKGTAIVLSSFGSVVAGERYENLRDDVSKRFSHADVFLSYSSRTVLKRFRERGKAYESLPEVLARLDYEGYKRIIISSVNLFPTDEHELLLKVAEGFRNFSPSMIRVTRAIFGRTKITSDILASLSTELHEKDPADRYLYVAHGSPYLNQEGYSAYSYVKDFLKEISDKNIMCTLEGSFPCDKLIPNMIGKSASVSGDLVIIPLLLVSGRHFEEDIGAIQEKLSGKIRTRIARSIDESQPFNLLDREDVRNVIIDEIGQEIQKIP